MMKKKLIGGLLTAAVALSMNVTVFAAGWVQNSTGWWYDYGNGTWPASSWQWIDGNGDGTAECYYFDQYGYCLMNTITPDGYQVDGNGAWAVNGAIQTRSTAGTPVDSSGSQQNQQASNVPAVNLADMEPVAKRGYNKKENVHTSQNALWGDALELWGSGAYAEFYVGGQYNTLSLTAAPQQGFWEEYEYELEIYGDDDYLLDSYLFDYKTSPTDITVDISGQDYIKLYWYSEDEGFLAQQSLYMKNAQVR